MFLDVLKYRTMKKSLQFFFNSFLVIISIALKVFSEAFLLLKDKFISSAVLNSNNSIDINKLSLKKHGIYSAKGLLTPGKYTQKTISFLQEEMLKNRIDHPVFLFTMACVSFIFLYHQASMYEASHYNRDTYHCIARSASLKL